jgi:hypothetical protein
MSGIRILISSAFGIYIPGYFVRNYDMTQWSGIDQDDIDCVMEGVENPHYWDAWDNIVANAKYMENGNTWRLMQDGDLFAYCYDLMTEQEKSDMDMV